MKYMSERNNSSGGSDYHQLNSSNSIGGSKTSDARPKRGRRGRLRRAF